MLSANVEQITDTVAVLECGAQGVGLFRTEYLFLDRKTFPMKRNNTPAINEWRKPSRLSR